MLYRIYTENTNYTKILELVKSYFPEGFTILIKKANKQNSVLVFGCTGEMKIVQ